MAAQVDRREMGVRVVKYFLAITSAYDAVRARIDAEYHLPSAGTVSCLPESDRLPRDDAGRVAVGVYAWMPELPIVREALAGEIRSAAIVEISEEQYVAIARAFYDGPGVTT